MNYLKALCCQLVLLGVQANPTDPDLRRLSIWNAASSNIVVYWAHPQTNELVQVSDPDILPGQDISLDSYVGHGFHIKEQPTSPDGSCYFAPNKICRFCDLHVTENEVQLATITEDMECTFDKGLHSVRRQTSSLVGPCMQKLEHVVGGVSSDSYQIANDFLDCVKDSAADSLIKQRKSLAEESGLLHNISSDSENYFCNDDKLETSKPQYTEQWEHKDNQTIQHIYDVDVHLERSASKIHVLPQFVSEEECVAMLLAGKELEPATVFDGKGSGKLSSHRKANQGQVRFFMGDKDQTLPNLMHRIYAYTNHVLNLDLSFFGQEDLNTIQYTGRGRNDTEPDQYKPHCDGECHGKIHKTGSRVATMGMYCKVADEGGHTHFANAGVHIKPRVGDAIFFSYIDPETKIHDAEFTKHSGCPVYEGTKQLVTHWMRLGVSQERSFFDFARNNNTQQHNNDNGEIEPFKMLNFSDFVKPYWAEKMGMLANDDTLNFMGKHEKASDLLQHVAEKSDSSKTNGLL